MPPFVSVDSVATRAPVLPFTPAPARAPARPLKEFTAPPVGDEQTAQWLADLRDPRHVPIGSSWVGTREADRCAVGWLLERAGGQWYAVGYGVRHTAYPVVCTKYGQRLIARVIEMNDAGVPWPRIATYIERRLWVRALLRGKSG